MSCSGLSGPKQLVFSPAIISRKLCCAAQLTSDTVASLLLDLGTSRRQAFDADGRGGIARCLICSVPMFSELDEEQQRRLRQFQPVCGREPSHS